MSYTQQESTSVSLNNECLFFLSSHGFILLMQCQQCGIQWFYLITHWLKMLWHPFSSSVNFSDYIKQYTIKSISLRAFMGSKH